MVSEEEKVKKQAKAIELHNPFAVGTGWHTLDGSYQGRKKLTFLWPCPHRQPNLIKSEQICRKFKIEQILKNQLEN